MDHTPLSVRLGLWRVTRHPFVKRLHERLERAGLAVAQLDRFEREAAADVGSAPPDGVELSVAPAADGVPDALADEPIAPGDRIVRARSGTETIGWCCLSDRPVFVPELRRRLTFDGTYLWRLYVTPAERGQGIGTAIVARAIEDATRTDGTGRIVALVAPDNLPSRRAFHGLGFRPTERLSTLGWRGHRRHRRHPLAAPATPE